MTKTAYFLLGRDRAELDFTSNDAAIAFAHRMARELSFWDLEPGSVLQVLDEDGDVVAEIAVSRPVH
jgi:hypothetical protein